jgi:hypothetical protein
VAWCVAGTWEVPMEGSHIVLHALYERTDVRYIILYLPEDGLSRRADAMLQ